MPKVGMEPIRRKQLTEALWKVLAREGMAAVTLDRVSAESGVSKGVTTYYFKSKDRLILEGIQAFLEGYAYAVEEIITQLSDKFSFSDFLVILCRSVLGLEDAGDAIPLTTQEIKNLLCEIYSLIPRSKELQIILKTIYESYSESFQQILEQGQQAGEWSCQDCRNTALNLMAMLDGMLIYSLFSFYSSEKEQMNQIECFLKANLHGIKL